MKTYIVTITKQGSHRIEASSPEEAEEIAREMEAEAFFELDLEVDVVEESE